MQVQLLRHATPVVRVGGVTLLVDPMLSPAGAMVPVANAADQRRIPLVELPIDREALLKLVGTIDAVVLTHTHRDHWDDEARALLPRRIQIFCPPSDVASVRDSGFEMAVAVADSLVWRGVRLTRTGGRHGTADTGKQMGSVSGYLIDAHHEPRLYITGDTIWCDKVQFALSKWRPDIVVINSGAAQFLTGGPITMNADDVVRTKEAAPAAATLIAVHFEAINHCRLTRAALRRHLESVGAGSGVLIPADGDSLTFG
jgi:L-ascorbate metabolism protein UlaG (beta-lactamase superfamily)